MVILYKIVIYFNAETQGRRVRRESWSSELELESGGEFLATKNRRCRRCQELELESAVGGEGGVRFWHLMQSPGCVARTARFTWATESEASALAIFRKAGNGRERCPKTHTARAAKHSNL
jgi:hypothetical protein